MRPPPGTSADVSPEATDGIEEPDSYVGCTPLPVEGPGRLPPPFRPLLTSSEKAWIPLDEPELDSSFINGCGRPKSIGPSAWRRSTEWLRGTGAPELPLVERKLACQQGERARKNAL